MGLFTVDVECVCGSVKQSPVRAYSALEPMVVEPDHSTASPTNTEPVVCLDTNAPPQSDEGVQKATKRVREALHRIHALSFLCTSVDVIKHVLYSRNKFKIETYCKYGVITCRLPN